MTISKHLISAMLVVALLWQSVMTHATYHNQPKILAKNGDLIVEAAVDRHIRLRLSRDSALMLDNVDIMQRLRRHTTPPFPALPFDEQVQNREGDLQTPEEIQKELRLLQEDTMRLSQRVSPIRRNTRYNSYMGNLRRNMEQTQRLIGRLKVLERKLNQDKCALAKDPCKNGGTCYSLYEGYHCDCQDGWTGETCEDDVDECYLYAGTDLGCQNKAVCENTPGGYRCQCPQGFSGSHCRQLSSICHLQASRELCGHGACVPANNQQGYTCICDQGWTKNSTARANTTESVICQVDVNECEEYRNPCHGECLNLPGSFKCGACPPGYTGNGVTCIDINECEINNGGCSLSPKVRCINTEGFYRCGTCPTGWIGDGHTCDLAPTSSCNSELICHPQAKCEYVSNVPTCTCPHGMFGHGFGPDGCHTTPINDPCENHLCINNGSCLSTGRGTSCLCPQGYSGGLCEIADACHPNPCKNNGKCQVLANESYRCSCTRGMTGKKCEVLRNVCLSIQTENSGELSYPANGTAEYAFDEECTWIIRTWPLNILNITFISFDVQNDSECSKDWLQIHDGPSRESQIIGRFCGNELPQGGSILSSQHQLFFWFQSDNAVNRPGFKLKWQSRLYICGNILQTKAGGDGVIRSPGYPGNTTVNRDCQWTLIAPYGYRFVIRIYEVRLGTMANCTGDSLKFYDADILLQELCQSAISETFKSTSNNLKIHLHTDSNAIDTAFQLHYEVTSSVPTCGGVFTDPSGIIIEPMIKATCLYLIQQPLGTRIRFDFLTGYQSDIGNAKMIEIFDGKSMDDPWLISLHGYSQQTLPVRSTSNFMLVRIVYFHDQFYAVTTKFKYTRVCELEFTGPTGGVFTTLNYPRPYAENTTCTYRIIAPDGHIVNANFEDFNLAQTGSTTEMAENMPGLDSTSAIHNQNDESMLTYVDIYLSSSNKQRHYSDPPGLLTSVGNNMTIVFQATTNQEKATGFRVSFTFDESPSGGVHTERKGHLTRDTFGYGVYIIEAPPGMYIKLQVDLRFVEKAQEQDMILIYGNATSGRDYLLKNLTNAEQLDEVFHFNIITILVFNTASWTNAKYEFVSSVEACGGNYTQTYGQIATPNWPERYPHGTECVWTILVPLGKQIELVVHNFTLGEYCGDFLEIRNGMLADSPLIGRYCKDALPSRIPSFANSLYLRFKSSMSRDGPGFLITWQQTKTGCGGKLTSYKGSIHSPFIADSIMESDSLITCGWKIQVAPGNSIAITISPSIPALAFCRSNVLKIYDDFSDAKSLLSFNCSQIESNESQLKLYSKSHVVLVVFDITQDIHFVLDYETHCHMTLDALHGVIESPITSNHLNCKWDIRARGANNVKLTFSYIRLGTKDMLCPTDYVEVWDMMNEQILQKYHLCREIPPPMTSMGNRLVVRFLSILGRGRNNFRAEYSQVGCGEVIVNQMGNINSPKYPYSVNVDCEWYFKAPAGMQIILTIEELKIDIANPDCLAEALTVKETKNSSNFLLQDCSSQETEMIVTSPFNQLYLHFHTGPTRIRKYFKASYRTEDALCGGIYKSKSGYIASPNYPLNSTQGTHCKWQISKPHHLQMVLSFTDIQMSQSDNCSESYVKISELQDDKEVLLMSICRQPEFPLGISSRLNVVIEYVIGRSLGWGRFSMEFKTQCGGNVSNESGSIMSHGGETCMWWIDVPDGALVRLNIVNLECYCDSKNEQGGKKECSNGLGFKESWDDAFYGNYTQFYCEEYQARLTLMGPSVYIFANDIKFRVDYSFGGNFFSWSADSPRGALEWSPIDGAYVPHKDFVWFMSAASGNTLQIEVYDLNIAQSEHCNEDFLEVSSPGKVLGVYCGNRPPDDMLAAQNSTIRLHNSLIGSTTNSFKLKWSYAHLNEISNTTDGLIQSPPITLVRSEDEPFAWRILANRTNFITLHFEEYIEGLELFDGFDDTALPVTIQPFPWRFVSSSNVVYLHTINAKMQHFLIRWNINNSKESFKNNTNISKCHSEFFIKPQENVVVSSPGYPIGYEPNLQCQWILKPFEVNEHVVCELYDLRLEQTKQCAADFLAISISSDLERWHEMDKLCNSSIKMSKPFKIFHGTPNLKIDFFSDYAGNGSGFRAVIKTTCGSNLTESVGIIEGDKLGSNSSECLWRVSTKPTTRILLQLNFPRTNNSFHDADCQEYALIHDGVDEYAPLLPPGKICNPLNGSEILMNSTSNFLTIKFKSSSSMMNSWSLKYRAFSPCNADYHLIIDAPSVNVTSPNYPNIPHPHTQCEWRIIAPVGDTIQVDFIDRFDMNVKNCEDEFLELFDGSTSLSQTLGRFCQKPPTLRTTQRVLYMRYLTDVNEPRSGFKAHISLSKCGGSFSDMDGTLMSPGYSQPGGYATHGTECDYAISLPAGATTQLVVHDISLPFDAINPRSKDHLEVIVLSEEYGQERQDHVYIYGNTTKGKTYHFNANKIVVRFHSFLTNLEYRGFKIDYHGFEGHCKQIVTGDSGYLTMGMVKVRQGEEVVDANCEWKIVVPKGRRVRLEFLNLNDFRGQNRTEYPRISIFSDPQCECKILGFNINSDDTNSTIQSSDNIMIVRMYLPHVDQHLEHLKAHYTSDELSPCPASIDSNTVLGAIDIIDTNSTFYSEPYYCDIPIRLTNRETLFFRINDFQVDYDTLPGNLDPVAPLTFVDDGIITKYQRNLTYVAKFHNQGDGALRILQTATGHIRRLRMSYKRHQCGGYFKLATWVVHLVHPIITNINSGPLICAWTLVQDFSGSTVLLRKYELLANVSLTGYSGIEYISIGHDKSPDREGSIKISQDNQEHFHSYVWRSQYTHIIYRSVKYQGSSVSMMVKPSLACGSEVKVLQKTTLLEVDKTDYENNQECVWTFITAPRLRLQFEFTGVAFIEKSINCTKDYLEFQRYEDDLWIPDVRFCGRIASETFNATSIAVRLVWRTNEAITGDGFSLLIRSHCSWSLAVTSTVQRVASPAEGFLDRNRTLRCDYTFNARDPKQMIIAKIKFNGACADDHFYVTKLNARGIERNEAHCESELELKAYKTMRLDFNVYEVGYYGIEYVLDTCGGNITTSGSFIRPLRQYSQDLYANNMDCVWYVMAPADYSIAVRFKYFDTEDEHDYVGIYEGNRLEDAKLLKKLSGNLTDTAPLVMVDHNRAILNAVSNMFIAAMGFEAEIVFMHNCNERIALTDTSGPLTLSRNFKLFEEEEIVCTYRISAPQDYRIGIEIKKLRINNVPCVEAKETCDTTCNVMEIYDSVATNQAIMETLCASSTTASTLKMISSYEDAMLLFKAKQPGEWKFEIGVTIEKTTCGKFKEIKVNGSQLFEFTFPPNGAPLYDPNIHCSWHLPMADWMEINFDYMDLQNTSQVTAKCLDYIEIKEGAIATKYCGHAVNFTIKVVRLSMEMDFADITFHSDASAEGMGFKFVAHRGITCNRTYHQTSGVIDFPIEGKICSNTIVMPDSVRLNIYVSDMWYGASDCVQGQNQIVDKSTNQMLFDLCETAGVFQINLYSTNSSAVRLDMMDYATVSYSAAPRNLPPGCGGTWTSERGFFASPQFYENDRNFSNCSWNIIVPAPNIVRLTFKDFDMGAMVNCPLDNVQIFDIYPDGSKILLQTLCGSELPDVIKSISNHVNVVSKKSPNFDGVGWTLKYVMMAND